MDDLWRRALTWALQLATQHLDGSPARHSEESWVILELAHSACISRFEFLPLQLSEAPSQHAVNALLISDKRSHKSE